MRKIFGILVILALIVVALKAFPKKEPESYTIYPANFSKPVQIEKDSKVIFLLRNESIFIKNEKSHCIQKALFFNFTSGYVNCGRSMMDTVYHAFGNDNLPKDMHFTQRELQL